MKHLQNMKMKHGQKQFLLSCLTCRSLYSFENGLNPPDGKGVSAPMVMLGFGGAANDKKCWKMNLLPFSKGYKREKMKQGLVSH